MRPEETCMTLRRAGTVLKMYAEELNKVAEQLDECGDCIRKQSQKPKRKGESSRTALNGAKNLIGLLLSSEADGGKPKAVQSLIKDLPDIGMQLANWKPL